MSEMMKGIIGSLIRFGLTGVFGWLVAHGAITSGQADYLIFAIATGAGSLLWSLWAKYRSRLKFFTALELPANASVERVKDVIANTSTGENLSKAFQGSGS